MLQEQMFTQTAIKEKYVYQRQRSVQLERTSRDLYNFKIKLIGLAGRAMKQFLEMENGIGLQPETIAERGAWT